MVRWLLRGAVVRVEGRMSERSCFVESGFCRGVLAWCGAREREENKTGFEIGFLRIRGGSFSVYGFNIEYFTKCVKIFNLQNSISIVRFGTKKCNSRFFDIYEMFRIKGLFCLKHRKKQGGIAKNDRKCYHNYDKISSVFDLMQTIKCYFFKNKSLKRRKRYANV